MIENFNEILTFWFGEADHPDYGKPRNVWFTKNSVFDDEIRNRFLPTYELAATNQLDFWQESPKSCLALIITLDQFPRNLFRGQPQMFATDEKALFLSNYAVQQGFDQTLLPIERGFMYLPFEHSENLADQYRCVELFQQLRDEPDSQLMIDYAFRHLEIIQRFGRFPHRNQILNRPSTPEELEFLQQPGSSF